MKNDKINRMISNLKKRGLDARPVKLTDDRDGVMVNHNYSGLYPDDAARSAAAAAARIAEKAGCRYERRGHGVATLIYI